MSSSKHPLHTNGLDAPPRKKPRFNVRNPSALATEDDDPDDTNAELAADVIGSNRPTHRRGAVNIDGFDSDSDGGDNFDARAAAKARADKKESRKSKDEEDADMFADLEEDFADGDVSEGEGGGGKKKKDVQFLNTDQIEGQVKNSRGGGHVGNRLKLTEHEARYVDKFGELPASARVENDHESSSESEVDDEERAALDEEIDEELGAGSKTRHAPKLDAFNMRNEQDEGQFDESGNFVRKAVDPEAVHDRWLEGTSNKEIKKAKEAMEKREQDRRKRDREDDARSVKDVLAALISRMERGETVLEALARMGKGKAKKLPRWQRSKKGAQDVDSNGAADAEVKRKADVEALTAAADLMLTRGETEIYDEERESLQRRFQRETGEQWRDRREDEDSDSKTWEYRWTDARDGGHVNGPYNASAMRQWNDAGYFGEGIEFRPSGGSDWSRVADF